jgi:hypothetical protein
LLVSRVEGDSVRDYVVDLRSEAGVYGSAAFYLEQGDVVYAAPTAKRARFAGERQHAALRVFLGVDSVPAGVSAEHRAEVQVAGVRGCPAA